jgi:Icc-related predicted phosphoesterase
MRVVAFTDIHGAYSRVEETLRNEPADVVILGGDLTNVGAVAEVRSAIQRFQAVNSNLLAVAGNMDLPQHDDLFVKMGVSINGRGKVIGDVGFFGVSGGPKSPLHTPYEISEEEIARRANAGYADVKQCKVKVFVPHMPPFGTKVDIIHSGIHVGSSAVRDFIEENKPDVVICGHIHEARGKDMIEKAIIVNCGPAGQGHYAIVEVDEKIEVVMK